MDEQRFSSRKFIVTVMGMAMAFLLAAYGMVTNTDPNASAMLAIGAGMGGYNWANVASAVKGGK